MTRLTIILFLSFVACDNKQMHPKGTKTPNEVKKVNKIERSSGDTFKSPPNFKIQEAYQFENDSILQRLNVFEKTHSTIQFEIIILNKEKNKRLVMSGIAKSKNQSDSESNIDENGEEFTVEEYVYKGKCELDIRIDIEENRRAIIKGDTWCSNSSNITSEDIHIMKRISIPKIVTTNYRQPNHIFPS